MLRASGWTVTAFVPGRALSNYSAHALTEYPTANGPADYALVGDGQLLGIVEAKKITLGPQNVLTQAERYSKGVLDGPIKARTGVDSYRVPFLYSTNGEVIWFHDVRRRLLVKPGMTGLWQINGRSDLSWDESVRFDLYYVENWFVMSDLMILWRTGRAVLRSSGAY